MYHSIWSRVSFHIEWKYCLFVDMGQFDPTKGKQALEIRSSLSERRSLADPIRPGEYSHPGQAHNLHWSKAHGNTNFCEISDFLNTLFLFLWVNELASIFCLCVLTKNFPRAKFWISIVEFRLKWTLQLSSPTCWSSTPALWTSPRRCCHVRHT